MQKMMKKVNTVFYVKHANCLLYTMFQGTNAILLGSNTFTATGVNTTSVAVGAYKQT